MLSQEVTQTECDDRLLIIDWASLGYQTLFGLLSEIKKIQRGEQLEYDPAFKNEPIDMNSKAGTLAAYKNSHLSRVIDHIKLFNPSRMLFALEGGKNWRYDIYPEYKANRKFSDWPFVVTKREFDTARRELAEEIGNVFGAHAIRVVHAEGDDIIAGAVKQLKDQYSEIIISTGDRDIVQLTKYPNVKIFDSKDRHFKSCEDGARFFLETKVLQGDKSDNILGIQLPGKKRRLGPTTAASLYNSCSGNLYEKAAEEGWLDQYNINKSLIDMEQIPDELMESIAQAIVESEATPGDYMDLITSEFTEQNIEKIGVLKTKHSYLFENQLNNGKLEK